jgi:large subunit ribosomal protein L18
MAKIKLRKNNLKRRKLRVRKKVFGTKSRPRLSVFRSNKYCYVQLIDDKKGETLVGVSLKEIKEAHQKKNKKEGAFEVGKILAEKAKEKKIKKAVFDRAGYKYHGRVKQVAEGAREGGLEV